MFNKKSIVLAIALGITNLAHADLSSGLVAYYPFNGNANDASGNGNNGIVTKSDVTFVANGVKGEAAKFIEGISNKAIEVPYSPSLNFINNGLTIAGWINFDGVNTDFGNTIVEKSGRSWGSLDYTVLLNCHGGGYFVGIGSYIGSVWWDTSYTPIPSNQWVHTVLTYDGSYEKIYLNAQLIGIKQISNGAQDTGSNILIGISPVGGAEDFSGLMDDVRIYNRALSANEIQQLYLKNTTHQLTITKTGTGSGTVTSTPAGINCGEDCSENYLTGSNVTLTATPDTIYCITTPCPINTWGGWGGDCTGTANTCTVNMDKARNVTAAFNQITPPTATTGAATNVTQTSATLNGTVTSANATAAVSFDFGTTNTYGSNIAATPAQVYSSTAVAVSTNTTDLTCGTTYHYRVKAMASSGTALGTDKTFTTAACIVNSWLYPVTMNIPRDKLFTLNVTAKSDGMQITHYEFVITFDPTKLSLIYNPVCNNFACPGANALNTNSVYLVGTNAIKIIGLGGQTAANNDLHLLIINFKSKTTLGITNVELKTNSLVNTSGDNIGLASRGATINITSGICGDANGDTIVNIVDALAIARKLVNLPPPPTVEPLWANVNTDNNVTIIDALHIARYSIGLVLPPEVCAIGQPL